MPSFVNLLLLFLCSRALLAFLRVSELSYKFVEGGIELVCARIEVGTGDAQVFLEGVVELRVLLVVCYLVMVSG